MTYYYINSNIYKAYTLTAVGETGSSRLADYLKE